MRSRRFIGAVGEQAGVHQPQLRADGGREVHLREDVAFEVDAGRDLDQLEAARFGEPEHAALGHVQHALAAAVARARR